MALYILPASEQSGPVPIAYPDCAGDVVVNRYEIDLAALPLTGKTLAQNDVIDVGIIPATAQVVDVVIDADDLDTNVSPALAFDVGVLSGGPGTTGTRTCGNEFFAATNVAQAGGVSRMAKAAGFRVARANTDTSLGVKITAAAGTQASSGKIGISVFIKG